MLVLIKYKLNYILRASSRHEFAYIEDKNQLSSENLYNYPCENFGPD